MPKEYAIRLLQEAGAVPGGENHAVYDCNGLHIHMQYDEGGDTLLLYVHLGFLPEHPAQQTYEYILELNFLGAQLGGGHVGLHRPTRGLVHSLRLEVAQQNTQSLRNALHLFAGHTLDMLEVKRKGSRDRPACAARPDEPAHGQGNEEPTMTGAPAAPRATPAAGATSGLGVMWG